MLFWIIAALMASAATAALMFPLYRGRGASAGPSSAHEMEVYRDQLSEIDRDLGAGLIGPGEADVARAEIGRRLLSAARRADAERTESDHAGNETAPMPHAPRGLSRLARNPLAIFLVIMPVLALAAYVELGSPGSAQQPLSARLGVDPETADIGVLVANAERHLAENPDDGRGWDVLAPIYLRAGRIEQAENAFRKAILLLGPSAPRQAGLGEALVSKAGGVVTEEARLVFQSARELDSDDPRPAFFLAVAQAQEGKSAEARSAFNALIARSAPDAPWIPAIKRQIALLDSAANTMVVGPTMDDIEAAQAETPAVRRDMIGAMVNSLEARLKKDPDNLDGWLMLVRSKATLGDLPAAQAALDSAHAIFPAGAGGRALTGLAGELGLKPNSGLGGVSLAEGGTPRAPALPGAGGFAAPFIVPDGEPSPGNPTDADIAAAEDMSTEDRQAMIRSMVASLDAKLTENPDNIDGWLRLVRSYTVLGEPEAARSALIRGKAAFAENSEGARALAGLANELELDQQEPAR